MLVVLVGLVLSGVLCSLGADIPRRCCFDKEFSVTVGEVGEVLSDDPSNAYFIDGVSYWGVDYYRNREKWFTIFKMPDGSNGTRYELKDYGARRVYSSLNSNCTYRDMLPYEVNRPKCIPDNATYLGPSVIGYGHQSMNLHTWAFNYQMDANKVSQLIMSVTQDHCVPISESIIGVYEGTPLEETLLFWDYHPSLERLDFLEPPQNCQPASTR